MVEPGSSGFSDFFDFKFSFYSCMMYKLMSRNKLKKESNSSEAEPKETTTERKPGEQTE